MRGACTLIISSTLTQFYTLDYPVSRLTGARAITAAGQSCFRRIIHGLWARASSDNGAGRPYTVYTAVQYIYNMIRTRSFWGRSERRSPVGGVRLKGDSGGSTRAKTIAVLLAKCSVDKSKFSKSILSYIIRTVNACEVTNVQLKTSSRNDYELFVS